MSEPEVLIERRGRGGFITLNRPKALNALNLGMVRSIAGALDDFERDACILRVVVTGAGGRAFCAGGDIRLLYEQGRAGDRQAQLTFWREEYQLNRRIKTWSKPYVSLIDGLVMGGGIGLSLHGSHIVASERASFAMPEVMIGFFPDVGAVWPLARLGRGMGAYLALTGARADAGDALALGLAHRFAPAEAIPALEAALAGDEPLEAILGRFAAPPPASKLAAIADWIAHCFARGDPATSLAALKRAAEAGAADAAATRAAMLGKSPTSQAIAARQLALYAQSSFDEALRTDFRIVSRICLGHDFYEGVRALIIDKDNRPAWRPAALDAVSAGDIDAYFAPLGADELEFGKAS
jgi:enoyl-CoA hydratase